MACFIIHPRSLKSPSGTAGNRFCSVIPIMIQGEGIEFSLLYPESGEYVAYLIHGTLVACIKACSILY